MDSAFDSITKGKLYTATELVSAIENDSTITTREKLPVTYTKEGLAIPETGGGAASTLQPDNSAALIIAAICFAMFVVAGFAFMILNRKTAGKK